MKTSTLLEQLKAAITAEEYENLTNNTITHISQYNRRTTLEIIGRNRSGGCCRCHLPHR